MYCSNMDETANAKMLAWDYKGCIESREIHSYMYMYNVRH